MSRSTVAVFYRYGRRLTRALKPLPFPVETVDAEHGLEIIAAAKTEDNVVQIPLGYYRYRCGSDRCHLVTLMALLI